MTSDVLCHCGQALHYTDPALQEKVQALVDEHGDFVEVTLSDNGTWLVQRHYIALHGVTAEQLPTLGFEKVR